MADGIVKVQSVASGDKNIDNTELVVGANTVERQRVQVSGAGAAELADVRNAAPAGADYGMVTRPIAPATLPLPTGASTEATLALIKAKTDNLDVLLSTRTKPADSQHVTVDNASLAVTGTFWQATQPISAASLPLPTGAAADSSLTTLHADLGLLAKLTDTQPVADAALAALVGNVSATPAAYSMLDRLSKNATEATMQKVLAAIQAQTAKPPSRPTTTLLHRS